MHNGTDFQRLVVQSGDSLSKRVSLDSVCQITPDEEGNPQYEECSREHRRADQQFDRNPLHAVTGSGRVSVVGQSNLFSGDGSGSGA